MPVIARFKTTGEKIMATTRETGSSATNGTATKPAPAAESTQAPARIPAAPPFQGTPQTGQSLYRWACDRKMLPRVNALGKQKSFPKLVTHWDADQVATSSRESTSEPVANGRVRCCPCAEKN
jgi:hypothetical protein